MSFRSGFVRKTLGVFAPLFCMGFIAFQSHTVHSSVQSQEKKSDFIRLFSTQEGSYYGGVITRTLADDQSVWLYASRLGEVKVEIYRVNEDVLFRALSYKKQETTNFLPRDEALNSSPFAVEKEKLDQPTVAQTFTINAIQDRVRVTLPIKKPGMYYIFASQGNIAGDAFVVASDYATQVKEADQNLVAWTVDTRTGRHIVQGDAEVYSLSGKYKKNNTAAIKQDGTAQVPFDAQDDVLLVRSGNQITLTPLNFADHSDRWFVNNWQSFAPTATIARGFLFTDRPLYQPGDTVLFKSILRNDHDAVYGIPNGAVKVKLYKDGYWDEKNKILEQIITLSDQGSLDGRIQLPTALKTGQYALLVEPMWEDNSVDQNRFFSDRSRYGSVWFEVQYYRKPEYGVDIEVDKDTLVAGDMLRATVSGSYFSGQPLEGQTLKYVLYASNYYDSYYENRDESTENLLEEEGYHYGSWGGNLVQSGTITLGQDGKAIIEVSTLPGDELTKSEYGVFSERNDTLPKIYGLEVSLEGDDQHSVYESKNALVMPSSLSIYQKRYMERPTQGKPLSIPILLRANSEQAGTLAGREITVEPHLTKWVLNEQWNEHNAKKNNGRREKYVKVERDFDAFVVRADKNGESSIVFTPPEDGSYTFKLSTKDDRGNQSRRTLYAWVPDQSGAYYWHDDGSSGFLTLQTEDRVYRPGDSVKVTISSSVPDRDVWLTLERDHVRRHQTVFVKGNSAIVDIPLEENDIPDIFLSGTAFDATTIAVDQKAIRMNDESKKMRITVETDKERYEPGETVSAQISARDYRGNPLSGEVTLWAVDKALFELVDKGHGNIFNAFWFGRYAQTESAHSLQGLTYSVDMAEGGGCFSGDTQVLMAGGASKNIRDVRIGDRVLTRRGQYDSTLVEATVLSTHEIQEDGYLLVNGTLRVTPAHRLLVNGSWKAAGSMVIGDKLSGSDGKDVPVRSLEWRHEPITVYNLTIEEQHSFFAGGILAHNDIGGKDSGVRSKFVDTAYWNPKIQLGSNGKAKVTFKLPDNTTTWVLAAVGADDLTRVGQAKHEIAVSKDVIVRAFLPNEVRVGDSAFVMSRVHNNTDQPLDIAISASLSSGSIEGDTDTTISLNARDSRPVVFRIRPEKPDEGATLTIKAKPVSAMSVPALGDTLVSKLPIVDYGFTQVTYKNSIEPTTFPIAWNQKDDVSKRHVTVNISSDLFGTLPEAMKYLLNYPYGCVEQTTSRLVPLIIARQNEKAFSEALKGVESSKMITQGIAQLHRLQSVDGSFGFWHGDGGNTFITAYVAEYLVASKSLPIEHELTDAILEKIRLYVQNQSELIQREIANGDNQSKSKDRSEPKLYHEGELIVLAYAKSILGMRVDASETHPGDKFGAYSKLPPDILALAVLTNVRQGDLDFEKNGARELLTMAKTDNVSNNTLFWEKGDWTGYYASREASTALAFRALIAAQADRETLIKVVRTLNVNRETNYWANTFATSQVIRSLVDFHEKGSVDALPNYDYKVLVGGKEVASGSMKSSHDHKTIELGSKFFSQPETDIQITRIGSGNLYTLFTQTDFVTDKKFPGISRGITMKRRYENLRESGAPIAAGDRVMVVLDIDTTNNVPMDRNRLVIEDALPVGLVPINESFKNEQSVDDPDDRMSRLYRSFSVDQYTRNGVVLTTDSLHGANSYQATYLARAVSAGEYAIPPAVASFMYSPEIMGYTTADTLTVTQEKLPSPVKDTLPNTAKGAKTINACVAKNESGLGFCSLSKEVIILLFSALVLGGYLVWNRLRKKNDQKTE